MTKLKTANRITVVYFMRAGYANMYICTGSMTEAVEKLYLKTGCKAKGFVSRKSRSTGFDFVLPLN